MRLKILLCCVVFAVAQSVGGGRTEPLSPPTLAKTTFLRVLLVESEGTQSIDRALVEKILTQTTEEVEKHFGLNVVFVLGAPKRLHAYLDSIKGSVKRKIANERFVFSTPKQHDEFLDILKNEFTQDLQKYKETQIFINNSNIISGLNVKQSSSPGFAAQVIFDAHQKSYFELSKLQNAFGKPLINGDFSNDFFTWTHLSENAFDAEIVITNQLIASTEGSGLELHSTLRGGIANGLTANGRLSKTGTVSVLSLYPFLSQEFAVARLRDAAMDERQAASYAALLLTHELGHQLLHLGHPFSAPECVMNPPALLHFKKWAGNLDAAKCQALKHPQMQRGVVALFERLNTN